MRWIYGLTVLVTAAACVKSPADDSAGPAGDSVALDTGSRTGEDTATASDDTGAPDSGEDSDDGAVDDTGAAPNCGGLLEVVAPGEGIPGAPLTLDAAGPAAIYAGYTVAWTVPHGELIDEGGGLTTWIPAVDAATHQDEAITLVAEASADGCEAQSASLPLTLGWPEAERVLIVTNPEVEGSEEVALAYAALHGISDERICAVASEADTTLPGEDADAWLAALQACLDAAGAQVHYIVPVYGVPYRVTGRIDDIAGTGARATTSLDALAAFGGAGAGYTAAVYNPAYQDGDSLSGTYAPFVPFGAVREDVEAGVGHGLWMVSRMDGADAEAALALVERAGLARDLAEAGALEGIVYVDGRYGDTPPTSDDFGSYESGEWNMWGTRTLFEDLGWYDVVWDGDGAEFGTEPAPVECPDALYYAGWYSYYNYNDAFTWAPGAIGGHLDSCSACDIRAGGVDGTWAAGALTRGITATFGAVSEPYVAGMPEYDQFFRYLTEGASYGEAAAESTVVGLWMMVWVGDPLYRPYPVGG